MDDADALMESLLELLYSEIFAALKFILHWTIPIHFTWFIWCAQLYWSLLPVTFRAKLPDKMTILFVTHFKRCVF